MRQIEKRLAKLEAETSEEHEPIKVTRIIVKPGPDGPIKVGRWIPATETQPGHVRPER